ncbi:MAG: hypothetical protein AB1757_05485 [Acidobacteriota bacterium]
MMKRLIFAFLMIAMFSAGALLQTGQAENLRRDQAVVDFPDTVKLLDVLLKGRYVVVHDDEKKAQGLPCLYVYNFKNGKAGDLVVSFHCQRVARPMADKFFVRVTSRRTPFDVPEIQEIQFAGSADGHGVHQ